MAGMGERKGANRVSVGQCEGMGAWGGVVVKALRY